MILRIPVKPYTIKFLQRNLGGEYWVSSYDIFGLYLKQLLRRPLNDKKYEDFLKCYSCEFEVHGLTDRLVLKEGHRHISARTIVDFNNFVERFIQAELHMYLDMRADAGQERQLAIGEFRVKYGITEDDWRLAAMVKSHQRYIKKCKIRLFTPEFVQPPLRRSA